MENKETLYKKITDNLQDGAGWRVFRFPHNFNVGEDGGTVLITCVAACYAVEYDDGKEIHTHVWIIDDKFTAWDMEDYFTEYQMQEILDILE